MNKKFMGDFEQPGVPPAPAGFPGAVVHLIGPVESGEQKCTRCGVVLSRGNKAIASPGSSITTEGTKVIVGALKGAPNCR